MTKPNSPPNPGDIVYCKADWDSDDDLSTDLDAADFASVVVRSTEGKLLTVALTGAWLHEHRLQYSEWDPEEFFPTFAEAMRAAARKEKEYGESCIRISEYLERQALQAERGEVKK